MIEDVRDRIEEQNSGILGQFTHAVEGNGFKVSNRALEDDEYPLGTMKVRKGWHPKKIY